MYPNLHVHTYEWGDDFAAARNASFAAAAGDPTEWVLWLDADDRVPDAATLKHFLTNVLPSDPGVDSWSLPYEYGEGLVLDRERFIRTVTSSLERVGMHK